jgi:SEC-C motif-containing protein
VSAEKTCPCGSGLEYEQCCGPYIKGGKKPPTAEALMRARYSAYAEHEIDFIMDSTVRKDKADIDYKATRDWSVRSEWLGLRIVSTEKGGPEDTEGVVEFEASYAKNGLKDLHHERGRFKKIDGVWFYDDGTVAPNTVIRTGPKVGRNDPCPCGSGKKYKHCCGS